MIGGQAAKVYWVSNGYHRGGYAYRLCRVYNGEYWKVTEECFQKGHLKFSGKEQKFEANLFNSIPHHAWRTGESSTSSVLPKSGTNNAQPHSHGGVRICWSLKLEVKLAKIVISAMTP